MARLGDRVVGAIRSPAHLELEQTGPAHLGASVVAAALRRRVQCRLRRPLAPAGEAEATVGRRSPAIGQGHLLAVRFG